LIKLGNSFQTGGFASKKFCKAILLKEQTQKKIYKPEPSISQLKNKEP